MFAGIISVIESFSDILLGLEATAFSITCGRLGRRHMSHLVRPSPTDGRTCGHGDILGYLGLRTPDKLKIFDIMSLISKAGKRAETRETTLGHSAHTHNVSLLPRRRWWW